MRNLNTVLFNAGLEIVEKTEGKIFGFSQAQNIVQVIAPFGDDFTAYGIFQANNSNGDVSQPSQRLLMINTGTTQVNGETYNVYESIVPAMVTASPRATRIDFIASFYARADVEANGVTYRFLGVEFIDEGQVVDTKLKATFPSAVENDYVRVIENGSQSDYTFDGTNWVDTEDTFDAAVQENRSQLVEWALDRGTSTGMPTSKPENTPLIIEALNLKANKADVFTKTEATNTFVNRAGDTMTGTAPLDMNNKDLLNIKELTGQGAIQNTIYTLKGGLEDTDAIKFTMLNDLFSLVSDGLQITDLGGASTWQEAFGAALQEKFDLYLKIAEEITDLGDLLDVTISAVANRHGLFYNSSTQKWENRPIEVADIPVLPQNKITDLVTTLNEIQSKLNVLEGAYVLRGTIANTTQQIEANKALLTARIVVLLERQPQLGDVLKDSEGGEWYFDSSAWRFMGQAYIDLDQYYTKTESENLFETIANVGAIEQRVTTVETNKMELDGSNSAIDELEFVNKTDASISKLFAEGCCLKVQDTSGLVIRLGKELVYRDFKNTSGSTIDKGTPVMFAGVQGDNTLVRPADITSTPFNLQTFPQSFLGLASQDIAPNEFGGITWFGDVEDIIVTSKAGETWVDGSVLYFDPTDGGLTSVRPNGNAPEIIVGFIRRMSSAPSAQNGKIFVRPTIYPRVRDLMGVRIEDIADSETIVFDNALGFFVNKSVYTQADADNTFVPQTKLGGTAEGNIPLLDSEGLIAPQFLGERYSDVYVGYGVFDTTDPATPILLELYPPDQWDVGADEPISEAVPFEQKSNTIYVTKNETINHAWRYSELSETFVAIQPTPVVLGTTAGTAYEGSAGQENRDRIVAIEQDYATDTALQAHIDDASIHFEKTDVSKSDVGLGSVQDFGVASQAEAEAGTVNDKYMTPLRTRQAIAEFVDTAELTDIGDVEITQPQAGDVLTYNGTQWVNTGAQSQSYGIRWNKNTDEVTRLAGSDGLTFSKVVNGDTTTVMSDFDTIAPFKDIKRCNLDMDTGEVLNYFGDAGYTDTPSVGVEVMVEIPKFYYKVLGDSNSIEWYVSPVLQSGFKIHPAFIRDGVVKDKIYVSAYEGAIYDTVNEVYIDGTTIISPIANGILRSVADEQPSSNHTIVENRTLATQNDGTQYDALSHWALSLLFIIEYATLNTQTVFAGVLSYNSGSGNHAQNTGHTALLGNQSGEVDVPAENGATGQTSQPVFSYRGIENLYGNIWKWMDGVNISPSGDIGGWYLADHAFVSNKFDEQYQRVGAYPASASSGSFIDDIIINDNIDFGFIPSSLQGSSSTAFADATFTLTSTNRVALVGGDWAAGARGGAFALRLVDGSGFRFRSGGARLLKF